MDSDCRQCRSLCSSRITRRSTPSWPLNSPCPPAPPHHFYADLMVGEPRHALTAKALDHEPAMIQAIAVHDHAAAKENPHPLTRQQIGMKIMVPKGGVWNEGEHVCP